MKPTHYLHLFLTAGLFGFVLTACGNKHTYKFEENGCSTEEHTFGSKEEYCEALKNHALNKNCAARLRQSAFERECPGKSWN